MMKFAENHGGFKPVRKPPSRGEIVAIEVPVLITGNGSRPEKDENMLEIEMNG